ncbi:MAG: YbaK/EbsC family protein [Anaerolineales bacterium]|nr:MAG: YbaK/EbsC family protein [Anaerolineales bacterium]
MSIPQTKVIKILEAHHIPYRLLPHGEPVFTVEAAARQRGVVKEEMVKSILLRDRDSRYVMACVLGDARVNPKAVRTCLPQAWRRLSFASGEEIEAITGCMQGAVAPLGLPDHVPVIFDEAVACCEKVNISSGDPMAGLELKASDLISASGARLAPIAEEG